jgi:hypothetical protein
MSKGPVDVLCIYRVKGDKEAEFRKLLEKHGPALKSAGLTGEAAPRIWKAESGRKGGVIYVEMMQWKDEHASAAAHQMPEVMAVWEPMGNLTDAMEFLHLQPAGIGKP